MIQQKVNKYKQPARPVQQQKAGKSRSLTDNRPKTTVQQKQLSGMNPVVPAAPAVQTKTKNTGLPENLQTGIEHLSGISMNDVNVHYNSSQPAQLHAHAYAQGTDIHIAPGQEKHLPHEAWHVVQQKQGRVKPTMQLKGKVNVNNDKGLEQEADKMGAKAIARQTIQPRTISNARKNSTATGKGMKTIQPVWIIRNGKYVWENDPYQLKTGESYPTDFYQKPSVLVNEGSEEVTFDKKGQSQVKKRKLDIPTHKNLQSERENQGEELYKKIKVHPDDIEGYSTELEKIAEQLEKIAGNSVPSNHKQKVSDLFNKKTITGSDFRNIIKAQDEFTQSQSSAAFLRGLRKKIKLNKPKKTKGTKKTVNKVPGASPGITKPTPKKKAKAKHLNQYAKNVLRVMSSLRTTTQSVVAPVTHNKSVTGQQHPTSKDQPKLQGGSSGHSYSDRRRVQIQNEIFKKVAKDKNAPPNKILLASLLGSLVSTLSTMSAPTHATNLPEFNKSRKDTQQDERERVKKMANLLAQQLGIKIDTSLQDFDEPWKEHETPTSPLRNSSKKPRLPKKNVPTGQPIKEVVSLAGSVQWVATQLLAVMQPRNDNNDQFRLNFRNYVQQVQQAAALVDTSLPANMNILNNMYNSLNTIFRNYRNLVRRRSIQQNPAGNAGGLTGQRLPALEQFFAECGQMAVHNALVLR
ncbi:MAG: DUF4157 domain-containing protein, partial [Dinghuibacter sp.]|nr:DUF4157 domain-containing protein [Dinghuibacter sp.]